jgi:hypothetical protein
MISITRAIEFVRFVRDNPQYQGFDEVMVRAFRACSREPEPYGLPQTDHVNGSGD